MSPPPIRVILIDDHKLARESWSLMLRLDGRFSIVGEFDNGVDAVEQMSNIPADVVLVDINMHPLNGFEVTKKLLDADPATKVIGISVNNQPSYANRMLQIGGLGYVTKGSPFEEVSHAIVEVHNGGQYVCNEIRNMSPGI